MSLVAVLALIYGVKQLAQDGPGWPPVVAVVVGLTVGLVFVRRQRRLPDPLLDLRLFRIPVFRAVLAVNTLDFFVAFAALLFIGQYLQLGLGQSPLEAGLWMLPGSLGFITGSLLTPLVVRRAPPALVMAAGMGLAAVGFGLLTQSEGTADLVEVVAGSVVFSLGLAPTTTLATDLMIAGVPPERAGAASGVSETSSELGGALGIAILGAIATAVYRGQVADMVPAGVSPESAAAARESLGGAVAVASQLPDQPGIGLLGVAREAFNQGLHLAFAISAAVAIGIAVSIAVRLRHVGEVPEPERRPNPSRDGPCAGKVGVVVLQGPAAGGSAGHEVPVDQAYQLGPAIRSG